MAIKSGELIHVGNQVVVHRAQSAGPGTVSIPTEKIYELGNYQSVATIRDIADLTFTLESFDVSAEMEAMLLGFTDYSTVPDGAELPLANVKPLDVASQFKRGRTDPNAFDIAASVVMPYLNCESISYRFGLRDNASQSLSLRGDSVFYTGGTSAYIELTDGTNTADQAVTLANPGAVYNGDTINGPRRALGVTVVGSGKRLIYGSDYTEATAGGITTITVQDPVPTTDQIRVVYQSETVAVYPQLTHIAASAVRPAAIKGRDIEVRIGGLAITDRWSSIQSVTVEQRLTLERDEELGNAEAVANDFDVPVVTGTVEVKPRDVAELMRRVRTIAGVTNDTEVVGPYQSALLPLEILLHSPDDGQVLKTLYVPDARFTLPAFQGQVEQKLTTTFNFESDGGILLAYKGNKP